MWMAIYRKLLPTEAAPLRRHLLRLTADERRMRFQGGVADLSIERLCAQLDWFRTVVVGYVVDGRLRGAAQLGFDRFLCPHTVEVAVTVETSWQGSGVGTELIRRAVTIARNRGTQRLVMLCLVENRRMREIARKLQSALHFEGGTIEADLGLRQATPWTLLEELVQDGAGGWSAAADRLLPPSSTAA
jgi:RimJ/RimL family protein N-acetyltransferase